ncbi:MAG: hypothetical protein ACREJ3_02960, partial [Polyangiaceae bacterium]
FGVATAPCANLPAADASATASGFVLGAGPYYAIGLLDDFTADAAPALPPGALTSLSFVDGSPTSPPSAQLQSAANVYVVTLAKPALAQRDATARHRRHEHAAPPGRRDGLAVDVRDASIHATCFILTRAVGSVASTSA